MESVPYLGNTLTRWRVGSSTFLAMPERGARLMNWHVTHADGSVRDVVYWPELQSIDAFHKVRGGNPILFPFAARSFDRGEIYRWRAADGVSRPMPMHGIARQGRFKTTHLHERGFTAVLQPDEEAKAIYPFAYEFTVAYRFSPLALSCEFILSNHDTQPIPWSAGHHFYFTLPWTEGHQRKDYAIRIPAGKTFRQDATGQLISGPKLQPEELISQPELIDTLHSALRQSEVVFGPVRRSRRGSYPLGLQAGTPSRAHDRHLDKRRPSALLLRRTVDGASECGRTQSWTLLGRSGTVAEFCGRNQRRVGHFSCAIEAGVQTQSDLPAFHCHSQLGLNSRPDSWCFNLACLLYCLGSSATSAAPS
jgi:galactose mutarotase-like enzyme